MDERVDLYAAGAVLFEMLAGRPLFEGSPLEVCAKVLTAPVPSLKAIRGDVSPNIDVILAKSLAKAPSERYASAAEMRRALGGCERIEVPSTRPAADATPSPSPPIDLVVQGAGPSRMDEAVVIGLQPGASAESPAKPNDSQHPAHTLLGRRWGRRVEVAAAVLLSLGGTTLAYQLVSPSGMVETPRLQAK
jgi:serine/threonine-protein kinase